MNLKAGILIGAMLIAQPAFSNDADVDAGKEKYKVCAACHGVKAQGGNGFPSLNWMEEKDIVEALNDYKQMINRGDMSAIMFGQAAVLSDRDIVNVSRYIVSLQDNKD